MHTKTLNATFINLSDYMEYLDEQELEDLDEVLEAFTFGGCDMSLVLVSSFEYELCNAPRLEEKFKTFREIENHAFQYINLSE